MQYSKNEVLNAVLRFCEDRLNQVAVLLVTVLLMYGMVYRQNFYVFSPKEKEAHLHQLTEDHLKKYTPHQIVKTGFILKELLTFDPEQNKVIFDGLLWFDFDPKTISLEDIDKCTFGRGCTIKSALKITEKMGDRMRARYYVQVEQIAPLAFNNFPVDDHRFDISIVNKSLTVEKAVFVADSSTVRIDDSVNFGLWKQAGTQVRCGYRTEALEGTDNLKAFSHNQIVFSINLDRESMYGALKVILPYFMILLLVIFSLLIPVTLSGLFSFGFSFLAFIAILIQRSVTSSLLPATAYYTAADKLYFFALLITFIICLKQLYLYRYHNHPELIPVLHVSAKQVCIINYWLILIFTMIMTLFLFS